MTRAEAIAALRPGAEWTLHERDDGAWELIWLDGAQGEPSADEIEMKMAEPSPAPPDPLDEIKARLTALEAGSAKRT